MTNLYPHDVVATLYRGRLSMWMLVIFLDRDAVASAHTNGIWQCTMQKRVKPRPVTVNKLNNVLPVTCLLM